MIDRVGKILTAQYAGSPQLSVKDDVLDGSICHQLNTIDKQLEPFETQEYQENPLVQMRPERKNVNSKVDWLPNSTGNPPVEMIVIIIHVQ